MFWLGLMIALVAGILGVGRVREYVNSLPYYRVSDLQLDLAVLLLLIVGLAMSAFDYHSNEMTMRALEMRPYFKQLDPELRKIVVDKLRGIRTRTQVDFVIPVVANAGNGPREALGSEIAEILKDAGFRARMSVAMRIPSNPPPKVMSIFFSPHPSAVDPANRIRTVLQDFINSDIPVREETGRPLDVLTLVLDGDPLFAHDGRVTFR